MEQVRAEDLQELGDLQLRSLRSTDRVSVVFRNLSPRSRVSLVWLDYRGEGVHYGELGPGEEMRMGTTFLTHPWVLRRAWQEQEDHEDQEGQEEVFFRWHDNGKLRSVFEAERFAKKFCLDENDELRETMEDCLQGFRPLEVIIRPRYQTLSLLNSCLSHLTSHPGLTLASLTSLHLPRTLLDLLKTHLEISSLDI